MLERYYIKNKARFSSKGYTFYTILARLIAKSLALWAHLRNRAYARGIFRAKEPGGCVVAVGSFFMGGAGKTPFCMLLAESLERLGLKVGFVSRGYRALRSDVRLLSSGEGPQMDPMEAGDEPYLISKRLPHMPFVVGKNRVKAARLAFELGADVVIADDALQHRRLKSSFEIELRPSWSKSADAFFPRGERRDESREVDAVFAIDSSGPLSVKTVVNGVYSFNEDPIDLSQARVAAFAGIAHPERFFNTLESLGAHLVCRLVLPDHMPLEGEARKQLLEVSKTVDWVICTEKDLVKLDTSGMDVFSLGYVAIRHEIHEGHFEFEALNLQIARSARRQNPSLIPSEPYESN